MVKLKREEQHEYRVRQRCEFKKRGKSVWDKLGDACFVCCALILTGVLDCYESTDDFAHKVWNPGKDVEYIHSFLMAGILISVGLLLASGPVKTYFPYGQHINPPEYAPGVFGLFLLLFGTFIFFRNLYQVLLK